MEDGSGCVVLLKQNAKNEHCGFINISYIDVAVCMIKVDKVGIMDVVASSYH